MKKVIIIVLILAVAFGAIFYFVAQKIFKPQPAKEQAITLTMWGLWEDDSLLKPAIEEYKKQKPNVTIKYDHQTSVNYRSRVQTQIGSNQGPDILMIHNTWLPMFLKTNSLSSMPSSVMIPTEYAQTFYPIAKETLTKNGKIYAVPRGTDGLALFYNEDILKAAGITSVPATWPEFIAAAVKTTVTDKDTGKIKTAGAALGSTGNVDHWSDIVGLLFYQQPNAKLETPNSPTGVEVLKFYTNFITNPKQKVWDIDLEPSTQAFAAGRLAFYFAPSWRAYDLKQLNPNIKFKTAPVPQLPGGNVGWASFWAYGVSQRSTNQQAAWEFLKFLTSAKQEKDLYQVASNIRLFGLPYSRVDLQNQIAGDPVVGSFVTQAPSYKSWYLSSNTFDQGINDEMIKYFEDAVNATLRGADPQAALATTASGVTQVLDKYVNPVVPAPSTK